MENKHFSGYIPAIFNMMEVCYFFYSSIESWILYNDILPHIKQIKNDNNPLVIENEDDFDKLIEKNWSSITVKEALFEEMMNGLILNDYPHVQFIHIQEELLLHVSSLIVSNLPQLKFLTVENKSLWLTTSLSLESIF